jgi:N-acylneuraminate cytidylyltransferase|tara:strand:+ start:682 stop:1401 length:720 start_codon:yes stop_codon:yes gene_type:complete
VSVLAIIPARGGSKTLPRKNIYPFLGKPLIYWSIAAAHEANLIDRVIVSTEDKEIAQVSRAFGAEVPFMRPPALALDDVTDYPVIRNCLEMLSKIEGTLPEIVVQLRPTSPLRPTGLIDQGIQTLLAASTADSLRVVCEPHNNPYKMWRKTGPFLRPLLKSAIFEPYNQPRQKLPTTYWQIGTLDVIRTKTIFEQESLSGSNILPLVVDSKIAVDIDDQDSLDRAEESYRRQQPDWGTL